MKNYKAKYETVNGTKFYVPMQHANPKYAVEQAKHIKKDTGLKLKSIWQEQEDGTWKVI